MEVNPIMQIYSLLKIGSFHTNFCEDFLFNFSFNDQYHISAVLDGCSMGKDSHFASTFFAKILHKNALALSYQDLRNPLNLNEKELAQLLLKNCWNDLQYFKNILLLETHELLTTLTLLVLDKHRKSAFIMAIGDGVVVIEDKITLIDQNNKPDYLAYHLNENFDSWFAQQENIFLAQNIKNIAIATDGIETFMNDEKSFDLAIDPISYLLIDDSFVENPDMLHRKSVWIKEHLKAEPTDDLGVIRIDFALQNEVK